MIETHTCIVVLCDRCGDGWAEDGPWHFTSAEAARQELTGDHRGPQPYDEPDDLAADGRWRFENGKPILCGRCRAVDDCRKRGHNWGDWFPDRTGLVQGRNCDRCLTFESDMEAVVEQMVAEVNPS